MIVYLAGGVHSGWQERVKAAVPDCHYIDPAQSGLKSPAQYSFWDMAAIERADLIFAYLEADNPFCLGAAFEIGYGLGLGKKVVLVDRKSPADETFRHHFAIVEAATPVVLSSLNEGITMLKSLVRLDEVIRWSPAQTEAIKLTFEQKIASCFPIPKETKGYCPGCGGRVSEVRGELRCAQGCFRSTVKAGEK